MITHCKRLTSFSSANTKNSVGRSTPGLLKLIQEEGVAAVGLIKSAFARGRGRVTAVITALKIGEVKKACLFNISLESVLVHNRGHTE